MANNNIGKWSVAAGVDAGSFGTGVNSMVKDTQRAEKSVRAGFSGMEQAVDGALGGVGASMSLFGMRVGFQSLSVASVVNSLKQTWSGLQETLGQEIDLAFLNDELGTTLEWLSSLRTLASENSTTQEQFTGAMQRFNQQLGQASLGSSEAIRAFQRLGLTVEELQGLSFEQKFQRAASALAGMEDRTQRARLAMELFGRGGAAGMLRLVDNLGERLQDVRERGGFTTQGANQRFQELNTSIDRMSTTWSNLWREFLGTTAPLVSRVMEGWRRILFHTEANPLALAERTQDNSRFAMLQMARRFRDTGDESLLSLESLRRDGYTVPDQFQLGGPQGILDAHRVLQELDPLYQAVADSSADAANRLERFNLEMSRMRQQDRTAGLLADISEADRIFEQTRNPVEQFEARIERLIFLFNEGNLSAETFERAVGQAMNTLAGGPERRLPGMVTFGSAAAVSQVNQTQAQIRDRMDTLVNVSRETRDALRDIARANPDVRGILQGGA